jgi:putative Mn2+ efflux pump MntP
MVIYLLEKYLPFIGLIMFGNIENLILASQGVVQAANPKILGGLSIIVVILWLFIGTVATEVAIQYSNYITFIGGLAIVILGIQAIYAAIKNIHSKKQGENHG